MSGHSVGSTISIRILSEIGRPLTVLNSKAVKFRWSEDCHCVFEIHKEAFTIM